ncbi:MAG: fumarylacetoacetate hydrolase family protein [Myxococcales bacterium]|nr:fumarylacetoacetate hydrolase family protein [Myxococcales bacterium]
MKLCTFFADAGARASGASRVGVVVDDAVVDLSIAAPELPRDMLSLLAAGDAVLARAESAASSAVTRTPLARVKLGAPVARPRKFLAIGLNYADHITESGAETPKFPAVFNKQVTCVAGPHDDVHMPRVSQALDYEGELAFVIGKRCRHVPRERAHEVIAGYCVHNDVSVRDWQLRTGQWTMGKSFDTHGPLGPWLTTPDEIDAGGMRLRTWIDGELRQDSNTKHLVFDCAAIVEHLSAAFTLEVGDVVATGTPGGVGFAQKPPKPLRVGDVMRVEIEGLGAIENRVVVEPDDTAFIDAGAR